MGKRTFGAPLRSPLPTSRTIDTRLNLIIVGAECTWIWPWKFLVIPWIFGPWKLTSPVLQLGWCLDHPSSMHWLFNPHPCPWLYVIWAPQKERGLCVYALLTLLIYYICIYLFHVLPYVELTQDFLITVDFSIDDNKKTARDVSRGGSYLIAFNLFNNYNFINLENNLLAVVWHDPPALLTIKKLFLKYSVWGH